MTRTPETSKAYREGRCIVCLTAPHAPARPRCDACDQLRFRTTATNQKGQ